MAEPEKYNEEKYNEDLKYNEEKSIEEVPGKQSPNAAQTPGNAALTRKILLQLDIRILPILALLFLCSFLDRTNVGNAKTYGLEASLKMTDWQYDTGLAVFYATYIAR